jgi:hypothetical protein
MSERRIPVMPMETHAIAVDAWQRVVRVEARVDLAINEILEIRTGMLSLSGEIASFAAEAQRDRISAQDERRESRKQINALTRAIREVRNIVVPEGPGAMREPLETLPEIIIEVNRQAVAAATAEISRHSDAKKLKRYNWLEKTIRDGGAETVKHVVSLILVGVLGWMAHEFLGTTTHEHRSEPIPQIDHRGER